MEFLEKEGRYNLAISILLLTILPPSPQEGPGNSPRKNGNNQMRNVVHGGKIVVVCVTQKSSVYVTSECGHNTLGTNPFTVGCRQEHKNQFLL